MQLTTSTVLSTIREAEAVLRDAMVRADAKKTWFIHRERSMREQVCLLPTGFALLPSHSGQDQTMFGTKPHMTKVLKAINEKYPNEHLTLANRKDFLLYECYALCRAEQEMLK